MKKFINKFHSVSILFWKFILKTEKSILIKLSMNLFPRGCHFPCLVEFHVSKMKNIFFFSIPPRNLDKRTTITIGEKVFEVEADGLETICELGRGAYGIVEKMLHRPSQTVMAVKVRDDLFFSPFLSSNPVQWESFLSKSFHMVCVCGSIHLRHILLCGFTSTWKSFCGSF